MKKDPKRTKEFDREREFAVILERIYTEIKIIGEAQGSLKNKLDNTMGMVAKNTEDIAMLNLSVAGIKDDVAGMKDDIAGMKDDIAGMKDDIARIKEDVRVIKTDFGKRLTYLESPR